MATIRAYTTIEQSRKLAEILPSESADMEYLVVKETGKLVGCIPFVKDDSEVEDSAYSHIYDRIACYSLTALLGVLDYPQLSKDKLGSGKEGWMVSVYPNDCRYDSCWQDNPIDACVTIIEKLNELKLL